MAFTLPELPYSTNALEPYLSAETFEYHYGKHHKAYVDTLNQLVAGTDDENASLEDVILKAEGKLFNQAAQVWNHTLYWNSMAPWGRRRAERGGRRRDQRALRQLRQVPRRLQGGRRPGSSARDGRGSPTTTASWRSRRPATPTCR